MIQKYTMLNVADNTGVKKIMCIGVIGGTRRRYAYIGDIITASAREVSPNSSIKKGEIVRAVVVRTTKEYKRPDGSYIKFDRNDAVIIDDQKQPAKESVNHPGESHQVYFYLLSNFPAIPSHSIFTPSNY